MQLKHHIDAELESIGLSCSRGERTLFSDLTFTLSPGEIQQISGTNGSGKTSLLRTLCGLSLPESGQILWSKNNIRSQFHEYFKNLFYLGHANGIKSDLTPLENLQIYSKLTLSESYMDPKTALERVRLHKFQNDPCNTLSAGQLRRVSIARVLLANVPLWILDEPIAAIDSSGIELVEELFDEHISKNGMILFTSHRPLGANSRHNVIIELSEFNVKE